MRNLVIAILVYLFTGCTDEKMVNSDQVQIDQKGELIGLKDSVPNNVIVVDVDNSVNRKIDIPMH
jgi:hypothetical protein